MSMSMCMRAVATPSTRHQAVEVLGAVRVAAVTVSLPRRRPVEHPPLPRVPSPGQRPARNGRRRCRRPGLEQPSRTRPLRPRPGVYSLLRFLYAPAYCGARAVGAVGVARRRRRADPRLQQRLNLR